MKCGLSITVDYYLAVTGQINCTTQLNIENIIVDA